jgi:hypothetical protein
LSLSLSVLSVAVLSVAVLSVAVLSVVVVSDVVVVVLSVAESVVVPVSSDTTEADRCRSVSQATPS